MESIAVSGLLLVVGYLSGSVPFGKLVGLRRGIDIQRHGSGNIGFANAWRVLGWKVAFAVLALDTLKGYVPVLLARTLTTPLSIQMIVGGLAIVGHCFPVWLRFRGGKGIATTLGVALALSPFVAIVGVTVYFGVFLVVRKSAAASITGIWSGVALCFLTAPRLFEYYLLIALFVTWTHRSNLRLLLRAS